MSADLAPCSCGSVVFIKTTEVRGLWTSTLTIQDDGKIHSEGCGDHVRTEREPKTIRCDKCGKRHRNPNKPTP